MSATGVSKLNQMNFYSEVNSGVSDFQVIQHIYEAGIRLECKQLTSASAILLYHQFFRASHDDYDKYLVASTCLFVAGKLDDDPLVLRDIINVFNRLLYKNSEPVSYDRYQLLRQSISRCELLILRMVKFQVNSETPHKYLFHYLKALTDWFDAKTMAEVPIARTAWSLLTDFYHDPACLAPDPKHLAVAVIYMTLQIYGTEVPCESQAQIPWYKVFCSDLTTEKIWDIMLDICSVYDEEKD